METTGMRSPFLGFDWQSAGGVSAAPGVPATVRLDPPPGRGSESAGMVAQRGYLAERVPVRGELRRERRLGLDRLAAEGMREGKPGRVEELAGQARSGNAVDGVAD